MKKNLSLFLSVLMFFIGLFCVACNEDSAKKYSVTIKIKNDLGQEWIFTPDVEELNAEMEYDGDEHQFYVDAYQLADHPMWGDKWFTPNSSGANVFIRSYLYCDQEGKYNTKLTCVQEKGEYYYTVSASESSDLWYFHSINLHITVF